MMEGAGSYHPPSYHSCLTFAGVKRGAVPGSVVNGITWRALGDDRPYFELSGMDIPPGGNQRELAAAQQELPDRIGGAPSGAGWQRRFRFGASERRRDENKAGENPMKMTRRRFLHTGSIAVASAVGFADAAHSEETLPMAVERSRPLPPEGNRG